MKDLKFNTCDGGFVAEHDGYMCFVIPEASAGIIQYKWSIQEGGGWTSRGGSSVKELKTGISLDPSFAEKKILEWIIENEDG